MIRRRQTAAPLRVDELSRDTRENMEELRRMVNRLEAFTQLLQSQIAAVTPGGGGADAATT